MAYTYSVGYSTLSSGPWTNAKGSPFSATTDIITGLAPSTSYYFRIITNDTVSGNSSTPVVSGPYTTVAAGPTESSDGATVTDQTGQIRASQTPGTAAPVAGPFDIWTLTGADGQAVLNGTTRPETLSITELYYRNHTLYQTSPNGNALTPGGPGWWSWNGTGWTDTTNPVVTGPVITINSIGSQNTGSPFTVSGILAGYAIPPSLQYSDNLSGSWLNLPNPTITTTTFSFSHPAVSTKNLAMTVSIRDAGNTVVVRDSVQFPVTIPSIISITDITLNATNFLANSPPGTPVGTITVKTVGGLYTGTNTVIGADASNFQIASNTTLQTKGSVPARNYNINLVATQAGADGSPFSKPLTLVALSGTAVGPAASSSFINIDFTNLTGNTLYATLFGSSMASDGPTNQFGSASWGNASAQTAAKNTAGFGLPGMYVRIEAENQMFNPGNSINTGFIDLISQNLPKIIDISTAKWSLNLGGYDSSFTPTDAAAFSSLAVQTYTRFKNNGTPCMMYEIFSEPDNLDIATYTNIFQTTSDALHTVDPAVAVIGTSDRQLNTSRMQTLATNCGPTRVHAFAYRQFTSSPTDPDDTAITAGVTRATNDASGLKNTLATTSCASTWRSLAAYNLGSTGTDNRMAQGTIGTVYAFMVLYSTWIADPLTRYGGIWDWFGDGTFGLVIDPLNNPLSLPAYSVTPTGYALRYARQYMEGQQASCSTVGAGSDVKVIATSKGTSFGVLLINRNVNASSSGRIALSHWPLNATGNATIHRFEISPANLTGAPSTLTVTAGLVQSLSLPGRSVTILTP